VTIELRKDWAVVRLPERLCLYEEKALGFLQSTIRFAEELHRQAQPAVRGVLVLQTQPTEDRTATWLSELEDTALFRDLVGRLDSWRWLLSLIRNAPVPWAYMTRFDCLGSAFELALSCQRRYVFGTEAKVGFPEVAVGSFPPGGVVESLNKRAGRTKEKWQTRTELTAWEALDDGLLHFCSEAAAWVPVAERLFLELLQTNPRAGVRDTKRKKRRADYFDISKSPGSSAAASEQLEAVWRSEQARSRKYPSAWDYCWQLVKERHKLKDPQDLGRLVAHITAGYFLSPAYQAWIATYLIATESALPPVSDAALPPLVIDLSFAAPPTDVLVRMLHHDARVVFVSPEARALSAGLNLIFNRLERKLTTPRASALWERLVTWYQGEGDAGPQPLLRWTVDDRLIVAHRGETATFLRLEGNSSGARPGLLEWDGGALSGFFADVARLTAEGVITAPAATSGIPLSVFMRSLFLEEMLRISGHLDGNIAAVTEALRANDWHFAGDDDAWDRFLRTRHDVYAFENELVGLGAKPLDRANLEIGTWKHARAVAKRRATPDRPWNPTAVSQHLAVFLGLVAEHVAHVRAMASQVTSDRLAAVALGFPEAYGTPLNYLRRRGRRRVEVYAREQWPKLGQRELPPAEPVGTGGLPSPGPVPALPTPVNPG
jgi:enoyl-CoA hydratase/carnithine racemase